MLKKSLERIEIPHLGHFLELRDDFGRYCVNLIVKKETVFVLNSFREMHGTGLKNFRLLGQHVEQIPEHHSILTPLLRHQTSVSEVVS
jgi:hypothetical protein